MFISFYFDSEKNDDLEHRSWEGFVRTTHKHRCNCNCLFQVDLDGLLSARSSTTASQSFLISKNLQYMQAFFFFVNVDGFNTCQSFQQEQTNTFSQETAALTVLLNESPATVKTVFTGMLWTQSTLKVLSPTCKGRSSTTTAHRLPLQVKRGTA